MTRPERSGYRIDTKLLFGKYRIISTLGAGSSGTVYLAEHLKLKVYRAIKCIPKDTARNTSNFSEEQLLKEAGLLKNLNHPAPPHSRRHFSHATHKMVSVYLHTLP